MFLSLDYEVLAFTHQFMVVRDFFVTILLKSVMFSEFGQASRNLGSGEGEGLV